MAITLLIKMIIGSTFALGSTVTTLGIVYKDKVFKWFAPEADPVVGNVENNANEVVVSEVPKTDPDKQASGGTDVGTSSVEGEADGSSAESTAQQPSDAEEVVLVEAKVGNSG